MNCIYQDRSGILWVATFRSGLNRHDPKAAAFQHDNIARNVYAVCEDRYGDVWLGTEGAGLYRFNRERNRLRIYHYAAESGAFAAAFRRSKLAEIS